MPPGHPDATYQAPSCRVGKRWVASAWGGIWVAPRCYLGAPGVFPRCIRVPSRCLGGMVASGRRRRRGSLSDQLGNYLCTLQLLG